MFRIVPVLLIRSRDCTLQGWILASACLHDVECASARGRRWELTRVSVFVVAVGSVNRQTYANICSTSNHVSYWNCYFRNTKPWWLRSVFVFVWFSVSLSPFYEEVWNTLNSKLYLVHGRYSQKTYLRACLESIWKHGTSEKDTHHWKEGSNSCCEKAKNRGEQQKCSKSCTETEHLLEMTTTLS